jgi:OFA family oxalate/formate antiporter-like MFS transporter
MQVCLGATYSWSVFVGPIREITGISQGTAQLPFTVFYIAFPLTMIFTGALLNRVGPRAPAVAGALFFGVGWILAGLGEYHFVYTVLGIGLFAGIGVGMAYIVPIAVCIRWFPAHKGLVTGIAVAGFGGGAALVTRIAGRMIVVQAFSPFEVFGVLGVGFLLVVVAAGLLMRNPPDAEERKETRAETTTALRERAFRVLYAAMFAGLAAGFAVNANIRELYTGGEAGSGVTAVALFAVANALGRIIWGLIFDRARTTAAITANLGLQAALLFLSPVILRSGTGLQAFAFLAGFNYGGVLVIYAGSTARRWGPERVGRIYGLLFSANIPASAAPALAGMVYDARGSFTLPFFLIGTVLLGAALLVAFRNSALEEPEAPPPPTASASGSRSSD